MMGWRSEPYCYYRFPTFDLLHYAYFWTVKKVLRKPTCESGFLIQVCVTAYAGNNILLNQGCLPQGAAFFVYKNL